MPASVELFRGRAWLAGERELVQLEPGALHSTSGSAHLELLPATRVAVHWLGRASLRARGPGGLEWHDETAGEPARVVLYRCAELYLELREGPLHVELPEQGLLVLSAGHFHLASTPAGGWRIEHDAGSSAELWRGGPHGIPRLLSLHAGAKLWLKPRRTPEESSTIGASRREGVRAEDPAQARREQALLLRDRAATSALALLNAFAGPQPP